MSDRLAGYIRDEPGRGRSDLTLLLGDASAFREAIRRMADPFRDQGVTKVATIDSIGFLFGASVALELGVGIVLLRKGGKSAWRIRSASYTDYSREEKTLEIVERAVGPADRVLLVDDWAETGSGLKAAFGLVTECEARVIGATVFAADEDVDLGVTPLHAVLRLSPQR
ncbi:adenine phosphoribosyltransferase [bacterium]|nr:MAG: adenine phosphoribosyltransferase [bacterium]